MADSRIKDLATTQTTYDSNVYIQVDKQGLTEAKKMTLATVISQEASTRTSEDLKTRTGSGLDSSGDYVPDQNATYINNANSLRQADAMLDESLKTLADNPYLNAARTDVMPENTYHSLVVSSSIVSVSADASTGTYIDTIISGNNNAIIMCYLSTSVTFKHNSHRIVLQGGVDFAGQVNDVISFMNNGQYWIEVSRSVK